MHDPPPLEFTRLLYPLHPGASWTLRTDPIYSLQVEGMDLLSTPAGRFNGWRMRLDVEGFGPNDVTHVWYGHDGYLGLKAHLERVAYDENWNPVGTMVIELTDRLDAIDLVKPGR